MKRRRTPKQRHDILTVFLVESDYEQATMAGVGGPIPVIVPPPGAPPPVVAPQLPFAADPGTITGWLLDDTASQTPTDVARALDRGFNRLVDGVPANGDAGFEAAMRLMTDEITNSDTLVTYLTATNVGSDDVRITTIHSIAKYSAGFGGSNALHGQTLGLLGEMVGNQLPALIRFGPSPDEDLVHGLTMEAVIVPSDNLVDAFYASPTAGHLMPQPTEAQGGTAMNLTNLCPLPLAWTPYFLDSKSPYEALKMGRSLVVTMTEPNDRALASPFLDWLRGACVWLGTGNANRRLSLLNQNYEPTAPDARVIRWMSAKTARYTRATRSLPQPTDCGRPTGGSTLPTHTSNARATEKEYSLLETSKIQAACGLTDAQWHTDLPEMYTRMLEEGRTKSKTKALLEDIFRPDDDFSLSAVQLNVTDELAQDVKNVNFGYNNDLSYESCHRGISPFAVIGISMAMASKRRRVADRYARTTNLTLADVALADTTPDPIPTGYHGMVNLLRRYVGLLHHIVGDRCGHHTEVRRIAAELCRRQDIFECLEARQIASLLWQIFMDARRFFSAGVDVRGNLPQSLLRNTYNEVATGIVQAHLNVPYSQLLGQDSGEASHSDETRAGARSEAHVGPRLFRHVPAAIKTILRGARTKHPTLTVAELMAAHQPPLQYGQVKLGPNGSCLDYLCLGACKNSQCTYKHSATATIAASRAEAVAPKLGAAYTAYEAAHA
jgi:hypothetical protein